MKHKKMSFKLFLMISFTLFINVSSLFAWLDQDKDDLLKKSGYIEEPAEAPVLRDMYKRALQCYMNNDFENALFFYRKILEVRNPYKDTVFLEEIIEKMLNYPAKDAKEIVINEYFEKGKLYYENQHYLAALNIWEKLLILHPKDIDMIKEYIIETKRLLADPYYERGWDYYKIKEYDKAIDEWEHVLALVPSYQGLEALVAKTRYKNIEVKVVDLLDSAKSNFDKEDYKKALSILDEIFKLVPKQAQAVELQKKIINVMRDNFNKYFDQGLEKFNRREYEKSIELFQNAIKYAIDIKNETRCNGYIIKARQALSKLNVVVKKDQRNVVQKKETQPVKTNKYIDQDEVRRHYNQGLYYYRNGYIDKAIPEWEIVMNLDPKNERAYASLQRAKKSNAKKEEEQQKGEINAI